MLRYFTSVHLGASVALDEKDILCSICLNRGCIPTKTLVKSTEVFREAKLANNFGIEIGNIRVNFRKVMERKHRVVERLVPKLE